MAAPEAAKERAAAPITAAISLANLFILVTFKVFRFIPFYLKNTDNSLKSVFSFNSHFKYSQKLPKYNDNFIKVITNCEKSPRLCFRNVRKEQPRQRSGRRKPPESPAAGRRSRTAAGKKSAGTEKEERRTGTEKKY